jgi:hypothetical protein
LIESVRRTRAAIERARHPGFSTCYRCERPWPCVEKHITDYSHFAGCFPLCEACWAALETPEARLPYYQRLYLSWLGGAGDISPPNREEYLRDTMAKWPAIEAAVKAGQ